MKFELDSEFNPSSMEGVKAVGNMIRAAESHRFPRPTPCSSDWFPIQTP